MDRMRQPYFFILTFPVMFDELKTEVTDLKDQLRTYARTYGDLAKVKVTKGVSNAAGGVVTAIASLVLMVFTLIFAGIGLGWWLGRLLHNMAAGFFCVAGLFFVLFLLVAALKRKLIIPMIRNAIISKVYE